MASIHVWRKLLALASLAVCLSYSSIVAQNAPAPEDQLQVGSGTKIPLVLMNSVNTRNARVGDQLYLQTIFPITVGNQIVIPRGTDVRGSIIEMGRPGRLRGRGEMLIRFEQMILPNGVTRSLMGSVSALDGRASGRIENEEGRIRSYSSVGQNTATVATAGATGGAVGAVVGNELGNTGAGIAIGIGAATIAALALVLLTRGPDIQLVRGTVMDMVLLTPLAFEAEEVKFREAELSRNPLRDIPEPVFIPTTLRRFPYLGTPPFVPN